MAGKMKTTICIDWTRARNNPNGRGAPEGAPIHWGCPRGRRCAFAHGEDELKGEARDVIEAAKLEAATSGQVQLFFKYNVEI
jgi:hypothetical protein